MSDNTLFVLGATGALGYAMTQEWLNHGHSVTALVRNPQRARQLLGNHPRLRLVEGNLETISYLTELLQGHTHVFHGINYPYPLWHQWMIPLTEKIIDAVGQVRATLLFPGNIYEFGNTQHPITENSTPAPEGPKGELRWQMYQILKHHSWHTGFRVIYLRLPDFFGPNVTNGLMTMLFGRAVQGKPLSWPIRVDIPHQFAYTPDVANVFYRLAHPQESSLWEEWNYAGITVPSLREWTALMGQLLKRPLKIKPIPRAVLYALGWFNPVLNELRENFYQFEHAILLDDTALHTHMEQLPTTPLETATQQTLEWFQNHRSLWHT